MLGSSSMQRSGMKIQVSQNTQNNQTFRKTNSVKNCPKNKENNSNKFREVSGFAIFYGKSVYLY